MCPFEILNQNIGKTVNDLNSTVRTVPIPIPYFSQTIFKFNGFLTRVEIYQKIKKWIFSDALKIFM